MARNNRSIKPERNANWSYIATLLRKSRYTLTVMSDAVALRMSRVLCSSWAHFVEWHSELVKRFRNLHQWYHCQHTKDKSRNPASMSNAKLSIPHDHQINLSIVIYPAGKDAIISIPTRTQFESRLCTAHSCSGYVWWGGGGVLSSNFVHQMCHQGGGGRGGGVLSQILPKTLAGHISVNKCVSAFKLSQNVGHT